MKKIQVLIFTIATFIVAVATSYSQSREAMMVLHRSLGEKNASKFELIHKESLGLDEYEVQVLNNKVLVFGNSPIALCRGAYDYLKNATHSIISWSGSRIILPERLPEYNVKVKTPFKYRYYMNSVTHGYTTPYWGWSRWEKEIDWMAMHGMNMPLIAGAHEAILFRIFSQLGLTNDEILEYFSGPAHLPWNRMGNIGGWDGPPPISFFDKQLALAHQMQDRMKALGMHPIVPAFAGFVPKGIERLFPNEKLRELGWGGFKEKVQILSPDSDLFQQIGKMYIQEWEKEFGKGEFYLADSFNEMDVPLSDDPEIAKKELSAYGKIVFQPIIEANPDAVWVMQGWTFPYHKDKNGNLFWTPERLAAMMSEIPDEKLLILDMANEYNALFWKIDYSWEMYKGFFGKQWIYSFIPNMGGKVPLNGDLEFYAKAPEQAIDFEDKGNLVGFGFAPEGIENNEIIYELLSDWGWRDQAIDLDVWIEKYCLSRYGKYPDSMNKAYKLLRSSALGSFTDHPRFKYQFRPNEAVPTVHRSLDFENAVRSFLACSELMTDSELYQYDAIELGAQLIGLKIDDLLKHAELEIDNQKSRSLYQQAIDLMIELDRILSSHPNYQLDKWVNMAGKFGDNKAEKDYYQSNAKRLITTWGGGVNEYAARTWSGLISSYYAQRWQLWLNSKYNNEFDIKGWEEQWIKQPYIRTSKPYENPIEEIKLMIDRN